MICARKKLVSAVALIREKIQTRFCSCHDMGENSNYILLLSRYDVNSEYVIQFPWYVLELKICSAVAMIYLRNQIMICCSHDIYDNSTYVLLSSWYGRKLKIFSALDIIFGNLKFFCCCHDMMKVQTKFWSCHDMGENSN